MHSKQRKLRMQPLNCSSYHTPHFRRFMPFHAALACIATGTILAILYPGFQRNVELGGFRVPSSSTRVTGILPRFRAFRSRSVVHAEMEGGEHGYIGSDYQSVRQDERQRFEKDLQTQVQAQLKPQMQPPSPPHVSPEAVQVLSETGSPPCTIKVVGIGGGGGNTVNRLIEYLGEKDAYDSGVEFWSINTDVQALSKSLARNRIQIGPDETKGLGAGSKPEVGRISALESEEVITAIMKDTDMVFVTAGMGGGTGSGAAPVVAQAAKNAGCLTVGIVTKPFHFEGKKRLRQAMEAISELRKQVDILIVVSNDKLLEVASSGMALQDAFAQADDILRQGIVGISEIITKPGLINVDFADVNSVMSNAGLALMGIGEGKGPSRAKDAAMAAITSPLLDFPLENAKGVVYTITGGPDMSLIEVNRVAEVIAAMVHPEANVIFGASTDEAMGDAMKVVVVATNFETHRERSGDEEYESFNPNQFSPGSAGFSAFQQGESRSKESNTFNGYSRTSSADSFSQTFSSGNPSPAAYEMEQGSNAYGAYEHQVQAYNDDIEDNNVNDPPPAKDEDPSPRRRGLGGWWYWWRN